MYIIMGRYQGRSEEIDSFDTLQEATRMLSEYRMAYSLEWSLWIKT